MHLQHVYFATIKTYLESSFLIVHKTMLTLKLTFYSKADVGIKFGSLSPETMRKLCLSAKFPHQKIGEITIFSQYGGSSQ